MFIATAFAACGKQVLKERRPCPLCSPSLSESLILKPNVIPASRQSSFTRPVNFKSSRLQSSVSPGEGASQFQALPEHLKLERVFKQEAAGQQSEFLFTSSFFALTCLHACWGLAAKRPKWTKTHSERLGEQRGQGLSSLYTCFPHAASAVAMNTEIQRGLGSKEDKA